MTGVATTWPQDRLRNFWELQRRALRVGLRLTANTDGELLLDDPKSGRRVAKLATPPISPVTLEEAEAAIANAEKARASE